MSTSCRMKWPQLILSIWERFKWFKFSSSMVYIIIWCMSTNTGWHVQVQRKMLRWRQGHAKRLAAVHWEVLVSRSTCRQIYARWNAKYSGFYQIILVFVFLKIRLSSTESRTGFIVVRCLAPIRSETNPAAIQPTRQKWDPSWKHVCPNAAMKW